MSRSPFEQAALGLAKREVTRLPTSDVDGPIHQIPFLFPLQSYFDTTLLEKAISSSSLGADIALPQEQQIPGEAIGLHPSSETPISVQFKGGGQPGGLGTITLKPGQIVRPGGTGKFAGFRWGLPGGWLGGGNALLYVFCSRDAKVDWTEGTEVLFHRSRYLIKAEGVLVTSASKNWPVRFPWTQAVSSSDLPASLNPILSIAKVTRLTMSLRLTSLAAPAGLVGPTARFIFQSTNDFGTNSAGAAVAADGRFVDVDFPAFTAATLGGNLVSTYPLYTAETGGGGFLPQELLRTGADDGGLLIVDHTGSTALTNAYVDICRYGVL